MKSFPLRITSIQDETTDAYTIYFEKPQDKAFDFHPGQYLTLKLTINGENLRRAFSLSTAPSENVLGVTIKRIEGGKVSNYLRDNSRVGDVIEVYPPMGKFMIEIDPNRKKHYILIGAGSGITPLFSMLKSVLSQEKNSKVSLWYGSRNENSIIFLRELNNLKEKYSNRLNIVHVLSQVAVSEDTNSGRVGEKGRLDKAMIYKLLVDLFMNDELPKAYYLCGPEGMMNDGIAILQEQGVYPENIFREYYAAPAPTDEEIEKVHGEKPLPSSQMITITLDGVTSEVPLNGDEYILDAALNAGIDAPFACQAGVCTTCRAKLKSGKVEMDENEGLSDNEIAQGFILTCQSRCVEGKIEVEYM